MAVNVNDVYQRVLALANKEQRGFISPMKYNLYANQAQLDIFEQYFYDIGQFGRRKGNQTMYADPIDILEEKIEIFHKGQTLGDGTSNVFNTNDLNHELYRIKHVLFNNAATTPSIGVKVEKTTHDKFQLAIDSPLTSPNLMRPIYYLRGTSIVVNPNTITKIDVNYIKKPEKVVWATVNINDTSLYDQTNSTDFELHPSEETKLVMKILQLAAIEMKDTALYQIASSEDIKNIQQEKQ